MTCETNQILGMDECAKNGFEMVNVPMYGWQTEINNHHMKTLHEINLLYDSKINIQRNSCKIKYCTNYLFCICYVSRFDV